MHAYSTLIPPYQQIVDRIAAYTRQSDWQVCRAFITSTFDALSRYGERFEAIEPQTDLSHMVAALIERLDGPGISGRDQAAIYAISADALHRKAAEDWFRQHPEELEKVWEQFRGRTLH